MRRSALVAGLVLLSPGARAGSAMAEAEALFRDARRLMGEGQIAEACRKFARSQELDPSSGTLLNLADCHAQEGRTASAWAEFLAAVRLAKAQQRPDREEEARQRAAELAGRLSHVTLVLEGAVPGLLVTRDGGAVPDAELGTSVPMDPGSYRIHAEAPGHAPWERTVTVEPGPGALEVVIPRLQATGGSPTPAPASDGAASPDAAPDPPVLGYVIGGVGLVAMGVGGVFGALALSSYSEAEEACSGATDCDPDAMRSRDRAETQANIANVGIGVGLVGLGVGALLVLTSGSSQAGARSPFDVEVAASDRGGGARFRGVF